MSYFKAVFFNFLVIFFANHILPGVDVIHPTKLPHVGGELIFAIVLGALNAAIYPLLKAAGQGALIKVIGVAIALNFIAYALLKILPIGIQVSSWQGYAIAAALVSLASCLTNYFEMKKARCHAAGCDSREHHISKHE